MTMERSVAARDPWVGRGMDARILDTAPEWG